MKAMIFAAGFGTRLQPLTSSIPKALVKVGKRPMLDRVIERLVQYGVSSIIINTHYLHKEIQAYIQSHLYSVPISISYEETILGTGCGLYQTRHFWDNSDFFVCNVDILSDVNLMHFFEFHKSHDASVSLAVNDRVSTSMLLVDQKGALVGRSIAGERQLLTKPEGMISEVGFCGMQTISPLFFNQVTPPMSFSIIDDYMNLLRDGASVMTWSIGDAYWEDIGTPEAIAKAELEFSG